MQRDLFIDFLKGICIISVILTHNLPAPVMSGLVFIAWGEMAVPLFLLVQAYHVFNSNKWYVDLGLPSKTYTQHYNLHKLWSRILKPFALITLFTGVVLILIGNDPKEVLKSALLAGGIGPGSYYVWIYLQFFLLLPICLTVFNKWGGYSIILFIIVSQGLEWLCIYIDLPEPIYRLTCFRYVFLIYLGYLWVINRMSRTLTGLQIIISLISLVILLSLYYTKGSLKPFLHDTAWRSYHWVCYFYTALLLPWLIWKLYYKVPTKIRKSIGEVGKCSYEIFLIQMVIFTLYPHSLLSIGNRFITEVIFILSSLVLSIVPVIIYRKKRENYNSLNPNNS